MLKPHHKALFVAFAFTVMADPVSSVAYAIEAALAQLDGNLAHLTLTMGLVVATIATIACGYHQLIGRFPGGGGGPEGVAAAFGEGWVFVPLGALLVDFTLTVAVSSAAAASAVIVYFPELADGRLALALGLAAGVGLACTAGHRARVVFATSTLAFVALTAVVLVRALSAEPGPAPAPVAGDADLSLALLAMPLGMALATGVEAPSNAIAQLGDLDDAGRRAFGRATIWIMVAIVGALTIGLAAVAASLGVGLPPENSTMLGEVARRATGEDGVFAAFQAASAMLLLAAAASSYLAGSGMLEALARDTGVVSARFARVNDQFAPPWGLAAVGAVAGVLLVLAGGHDQSLVQFYAVAVFASFLAALLAAARLALRDGKRLACAVDLLGVALVAFVLVLNLERLDSSIALAASILVSVALWRRWVAAGRPAGVARIAR